MTRMPIRAFWMWYLTHFYSNQCPKITLLLLCTFNDPKYGFVLWSVWSVYFHSRFLKLAYNSQNENNMPIHMTIKNKNCFNLRTMTTWENLFGDSSWGYDTFFGRKLKLRWGENWKGVCLWSRLVWSQSRCRLCLFLSRLKWWMMKKIKNMINFL